MLILNHLHGTPLARSRLNTRFRERFSPMVRWNEIVERGSVQGDVRIRDIIQDGEDPARRSLLDFFTERVRIVGQKIFLRVIPVARFYDDGHPPVWLQDLSLEMATALPASVPHLFARPDRASSLIEDWTIEDDRYKGMIERVSKAIPVDLLDESVVGLAANLLPQLAVGIVDGMAGVRDVERTAHAAMLERVNPLRHLAMLGSIGGVTEMEVALQQSARAFEAIAGTYPEGPETITARRLRRHIDRRLAPVFEHLPEDNEFEALLAVSAASPSN